MGSRYVKRKRSFKSVTVSSEKLLQYIFRITSNEKQFPKSIRYTIVSDIRNTCIKIHKNIYRAISIRPRYKGEYYRKQKYQQKAYNAILDLKLMIGVSIHIARIKNLSYLGELFSNLIADYNRWIKNDKRRYKDLPTKSEFLKNTDRNCVIKTVDMSIANIDPDIHFRGADGFIHLVDHIDQPKP